MGFKLEAWIPTFVGMTENGSRKRLKKIKFVPIPHLHIRSLSLVRNFKFPPTPGLGTPSVSHQFSNIFETKMLRTPSNTGGIYSCERKSSFSS